MGYWGSVGYRKTLKRQSAFKQSKTLPVSYIDSIVSNIHNYMGNDLRKVISFIEAGQVAGFGHAQRIKKAVLDHLQQTPSIHGVGKGWATTLTILAPYLTQSEKELAVDALIKNKEYFYSYANKQIASLAIDFILPNDPRAFTILKNYLRNIDNDILGKILVKIDGGIENADVKVILQKTKKLQAINYKEEDVKTDPQVRQKLLKEIANTTSIAKQLAFPVVVELDDIKAIPPAARLNFLQFAYKPEITFTNLVSRSAYWWGKYSHNIPSSLNQFRTKAKIQNLIMPQLTKENLEGLLFSVALQKNEEMTKFITSYQKYLDVINGKKRKHWSDGW